MARSIGIVGAGIVGLATGWFLQELGAEVTVFDRAAVGSGASYANAGWICPPLVTPLAEPSVLRDGFRSLSRRDAPLRIPLRSLIAAAPFLVCFARNCSAARWARGLAALQPLCEFAVPAYEALEAGGVVFTRVEAPLLAVFEHRSGVEALRHELQLVEDHGVRMTVTELGGDALSQGVPLLSKRARYGLRIERQHYLDPAAFVISLANSFVARGGRLILSNAIEGVEASDTGVRARGSSEDRRFSDIVLAHGAWLSGIGRKFGIRTPLVAGRGYSCRVPSTVPLSHPLYLPEQRVACTPVPGGIRLAGTMEITAADAPLHRRRIDAIVHAASALLRDSSGGKGPSDLWVGARPVTADGLPVIGSTLHQRVFAAGGHGMWGVTLGPASGQLLAQLIMTSSSPPALRAFDPCR